MSIEADYPRIVVGDELVEYLDAVEGQDSRSESATLAKQTASYCRRLLHRDDDDKLVLDFLGAAFKEGAGDSISDGDLRSIFTFVRGQADSDDLKKAHRNKRLLTYMESRARLWGFDDAQDT